jgi:hypothetical protein
MRRLVAVMVLAVVGAACGGGTTSTTGSTSMTTSNSAQALVGTLTLFDLETESAGCQGKGSFSDIHNGTPMSLLDRRGNVLSKSELYAGVSLGTSLGTAACLYHFQLEHVPTASSYLLQVGANSAHGQLRFTAAQLSQAQWQVNLKLGESSGTTTTG